jgi:hypothetical protein
MELEYRHFEYHFSPVGNLFRDARPVNRVNFPRAPLFS